MTSCKLGCYMAESRRTIAKNWSRWSLSQYNFLCNSIPRGEIYLCIDFGRQLVLTKVFHVRLRVMACLTRLRVMACHTRLRVMACRVMSCTAACRSMRVNVDGLLVHGVPCRVMRPILPLRVVPCFPFLHWVCAVPCRVIFFACCVSARTGNIPDMYIYIYIYIYT